jgi:hypothetical protein
MCEIVCDCIAELQYHSRNSWAAQIILFVAVVQDGFACYNARLVRLKE